MRMWDIERGITLHEFVGHDSYVSHCSTNLTGVTLSCSLDKTVRLFHRAQSTALWHFEPEHVAHSVQFLPAQQFHFLTAHDEYMCLWDMRMLKCHQAFMLHDPALGHVTDDETDRVWGDAPVPARAPSRDSRATGWASSWLSEFDAMDASVDDEISAPQLNPPLLRVETRAANKDQQRTVRQVYNKKTQQYELPFTLHSNNTYSAQVTPDGLFIVTAARECFKLWNVHDQRGVRSYAGLEQGHHRVTPTFNHSATQLLAGSAAGEIHIWEMYKDKENVHPHSGGVLPYRKYKTSEFAITALALACNDTSVAVADISGQVRIYTASS
jgi:WD40 repeat protein